VTVTSQQQPINPLLKPEKLISKHICKKYSPQPRRSGNWH